MVEIIRRLTALTSVTVAGNTINPRDFFRNHKGLWVSDNFKDFILAGASKKLVSAPPTTIGSASLAQDANDGEIGAELPEGHVFEDVDIFLVYLATLIEGQWGGKEGVLLNNGRDSIFYVKVEAAVFAVYVRWYADRREWECVVSRLDGVRWGAGRRAFSATATEDSVLSAL